MIQQINLYQLQDNDDRHLYVNRYSAAAAILLVVLTVVSMLHWRQLLALETRQQQLEEQLQQTTSQILLLQANSPNQQSDLLINQEIQHSQAAYQSLSNIVERLGNDQTDQSRGFSRYLTALAEQADSAVWLTRIHIDAQNDEILLTGTTPTPSAIPALLQRLRQAPAFSGHRFGHLTILQSTANPTQVDFTVSSTVETSTDGSHDH